MTSFTVLLLRVGLLLGAAGAVGQLAFMIVGLFNRNVVWYWTGSLAFFVAPVLFAVTLRLLSQQESRVFE